MWLVGRIRNKRNMLITLIQVDVVKVIVRIKRMKPILVYDFNSVDFNGSGILA